MRRYPCQFCDHHAASETAWDDHRRQSHPRPRRDFSGPLAPYLTHASAFGVEDVFEAALSDARTLGSDPRERVRRLALLGRRLREVDKRWRSPLGLERAILFHDQGHDAQTIADLLGVTRGTVQKRIRSILHGPGPDETASQTPVNVEVFAASEQDETDGPGYAADDV